MSFRPVTLSRLLSGSLCAALAVTALVLAGPSAAGADATCGPAEAPCPALMHFGAATLGLPGGTSGLSAFTSALGSSPDVALSFTSFRHQMNVIGLSGLVANGQLPMVTWEPFDATAPTANPYPLSTIAAGGFDTYLRAQAAAVRSVGGQVALRFGHEMNAGWYPWGAGVNGNTPADYVAAYRHIHDLFLAEGVTNVTWVWSPAALDTAVQPDLAGFRS